MQAFDPIRLSEKLERIVCKEIQGRIARKYLRVRYARFYRGCITVDVVGCNLRCIFCWAPPARDYPEFYGKFKLASTVFNEVVSLCKKHKVGRVRFSGGEPTIGRQHLLEVLQLLEESPKVEQVILETNGILIGYDESYAKDLAKFNKLIVRVSIKAGFSSEFSRRTGALEKYFYLPFKAIEYLLNEGIYVYVALMTDPRLVSIEERKRMFKLLLSIDSSLTKEVEEECIEPYPMAVKRLRLAGFDFL